MSERKKRDAAMSRAAENPDNNHALILLSARHWVTRRPVGARLVSGEVYRAVMEANPNLEPEEKRVMGPVMRALAREGLISKCGISSRERSHLGMTTEWKRIRA